MKRGHNVSFISLSARRRQAGLLRREEAWSYLSMYEFLSYLVLVKAVRNTDTQQ